MSATVGYAGGTFLTYSLIAYAPYEGWRATLTGTGGRMELIVPESGPAADLSHDEISVFDSQGGLTTHEVPRATGGHGGADERLWQQLFSAEPPADPLGYRAGSRVGAMSILIGAAANQSMETGQRVQIADLLDAAAASA
jgi:hypothetical protein